MELEELKTQWNQLNEHLQQSEQLNTQLLKKITTQQINSVWNHFIKYAVYGSIIGFISLIVLLINHDLVSFRLQDSPGEIVLYSLLGFITIYEVIIAIILIRNNPVEKKLTQAFRFVLTYQKWVKTEAILSMLTISVLIPLMAYWRHFHSTWLYIYCMALILLGIGVGIYIYWHYMKSFRTIRKNLKELEEFEKEK